MPSTLLRRALAAALLLTPLGFSVAGAAPCLRSGADGWAGTTPDKFTAGPPTLSDFAMLPKNPDRMVVTNGYALQLTTDGGCDWSPVTLPDAGLLGPLAPDREIVDVDAAAQRDTGVETVWVLAQQRGTLDHPEVFASHDGGESFAASARGLPPAGEARSIAAGPDGQTAYVVVQLPSPGDRRLYVTADGGQSWNPSGPEAFAYDAVAVDTMYRAKVWAWDGARLALSVNEGGAFTPVDLGASGGIRDVAVGQAARGTRLNVLLENGLLLRSDNDGKDWSRRKVDVRADQVAAAPELDVAAIGGPRLVTILPSVFRPVDASPLGDEPLDLTLAVDGGELTLAGRVGDHVAVHTGDIVTETGPALRPARLTVPVAPALLPGEATVTLKPGETRVLDYELDVPAKPSPIEVFFLIDTTGSMGGVITGVRDGLAKIVNDLAGAGISSRFGVGEVKEYPFDPYSSGDDLPYKLFRKVGPVDEELESALAQLQASGGGDGPEAMTTGYYQLATGEGQVVNGVTMVPKGDDAGFGAGAMRIVIASTDVEYHHEPTYLGPSADEAHAALRRERINVIGLSAGPSATRDLKTTAYDTRTLAPRHGVDCDLDGKVDVPEGEPLVCEITGGVGVNVGGSEGIIVDTGGTVGIAPAIVNLLRGIRDPATLTLRSSAPDVATVVGDASVGVDLKLPHAVPYRVRVSCPAARYGTTSTATLTGASGGRHLASGTLSVRCLAPVVAAAPEAVQPPPVPQEVVNVPQQKPPAAAAAAPPAPPVQPVQNLNPNTNPNPNPNAQLQAGAAQQRQEQFQLALAQNTGAEVEEEYAMVGLDPPAVVVPAFAALMAAAAGSAMALRTRPSPALATVPARRRRGR